MTILEQYDSYIIVSAPVQKHKEAACQVWFKDEKSWILNQTKVTLEILGRQFLSQLYNTSLQQFSQYVHEKDPDIIVCLGDYDNGKKLRYLSDRGVDLELRICISSSYRKTTYFDEFGFAGLIERARFGFLPLDLTAKYSINRLIDSGELL